MNQKGKNLARIGVILQLGLLIGLWSMLVAMVMTFNEIAPGKPVEQNAMTVRLNIAFGATSIGFALALIGAVFILLAIFAAKYRAPWFYSNLWAISILWLIAAPLGTFLGILMMIYLATHRHEFMEGPKT